MTALPKWGGPPTPEARARWGWVLVRVIRDLGYTSAHDFYRDCRAIWRYLDEKEAKERAA